MRRPMRAGIKGRPPQAGRRRQPDQRLHWVRVGYRVPQAGMPELVKPGTSQLAASVEPLWPCLSYAAPSHPHPRASAAYPPGPARSSPPRQVVLQHVDLVENPPTAARLELYHGGDASALHFPCFLSQPVSPDWLDAHHRLRRELGWRDHHRFGAAGAAPVCPALVAPWHLSGRVRGRSVSPPCGTMRDDTDVVEAGIHPGAVALLTR